MYTQIVLTELKHAQYELRSNFKRFINSIMRTPFSSWLAKFCLRLLTDSVGDISNQHHHCLKCKKKKIIKITQGPMHHHL